MGCDEIREQLVDLVYYDGGAPPADAEIEKHLRACPACRKEVEELKRTRGYLKLWKDEAPLRSVLIARCEKAAHINRGFRYIRYAAVAAMILISFLAIANAKVSWNKDGFSFSTHLFAQPKGDLCSRAELYEALDDMNKTNYRMMLKMKDVVEQNTWRDIRLSQNNITRNHN